MTEFDDHYDDNDSICPYCGDRYQVESEDYSEDERVEECDNCGKKYFLCQIFSIDHHTRPDCEINGDEHQFQFEQTKNGGAYFCKVCGKCKIDL